MFWKMFNLIEKLRQKSPRVKKQIAFLMSFSIALIIFVVWFSVIYPDFRQTQAKEQKVSSLEPSPISTFGQTLGTGITAIKEEFKQLKGAISSFSTDPAHYSASTSPANMQANITASPIFTSVGTTTMEQ